MSTRRQKDLMQYFHAKASMSEKASKKDPELAYYAGATLDTGLQIARCDFYLKHNLFPFPFNLLLKLKRAELQQKRKAEFAAYAGEITTLGLMLGLQDEFLDVT